MQFTRSDLDTLDADLLLGATSGGSVPKPKYRASSSPDSAFISIRLQNASEKLQVTEADFSQASIKFKHLEMNVKKAKNNRDQP